MLNISKNSIEPFINREKYSVFKKLKERSISKALIRILIITFIIGIICLFLPWTQNIRTLGYVTTLSPDDRPQAIQSLIDGRIQKWVVREGDVVSVGDTILVLTESKEEYLDPNLLAQTQGQIEAKMASSINYRKKAETLDEQYKATITNRDLKLQQNGIKLQQLYIKIKTDSIDLAAAKVKMENSRKQMDRTIELEKQGIKSTTDVEIKTFSFREADAKVNEIENKLLNNKNDVIAIKTNVSVIKSDFDQKLAKIQSDKMSALSMKNTTNSEVYKLESSYNKFEARSNAYVITSPINGTITYAIISGIGEYIKAGEDLVTIVPTVYRKAVESYILPRDVPLLKKGEKVRIQFDGWPVGSNSIPSNPMPPNVPFPRRLTQSKKEENEKGIVETFRKVQVNIPLLNAIKQVPKYAKFFKKLCTTKKRIPEKEVVLVSENVSIVLQRKLPPKCKDPGSFNIPCVIGNTKFEHAMLDLGASINVMPYSVYASMNLGELKNDGAIIQLANRSNAYPKGVLEDVLVQVDHLIFLVDFYVLEMEDLAYSTPMPILLG